MSNSNFNRTAGGASPLIGRGWSDMLFNASGAGTPAVAPTFGNLGGNLSFYRGYTFAATGTDELYLLYHPNHDYMPGTPIHFHVHWSPTSTATGNVVFGWEYSFARGYGVEAFPASTTVRVTQAAGGATNLHQIAETDPITISNFETDGLLLVRFFRDGDNSADTYGAAVNVYTMDIHYESDGLFTLNRNRNPSGTAWDR